MAEFVEVEGNLLEPDPAWGIRAIAHGCNCMGVMGAGIAKQIATKWPAVLQVYKDECIAGRFTLGKYHGIAVNTDPLFVVFNLATQHLPGPNAELPAITQALHGALIDCAHMGIDKLGVCQIGCGIGGVEWSDVSSIMKTLVSDTGVGITAVHYV